MIKGALCRAPLIINIFPYSSLSMAVKIILTLESSYCSERMSVYDAVDLEVKTCDYFHEKI